MSPVAFAMQRPKSVKKDMERGLQAPEASKACNRSEGLVAMGAPGSLLHILQRL